MDGAEQSRAAATGSNSGVSRASWLSALSGVRQCGRAAADKARHSVKAGGRAETDEGCWMRGQSSPGEPEDGGKHLRKGGGLGARARSVQSNGGNGSRR